MVGNAVATPTTVRSITALDDDILSDETLWQIVSAGDLKNLTPSQKSAYYLYRCRQEGLNPASQPFQYLSFQGKEILYATRSAADQLRRVHGVSIVSVECVEDGEYISYEVRVRDREGREDFEIGSVFVGTTKGEGRSNARMKALTKAKRRATYSICGTGTLDETEVAELIPRTEQPEPTYAALPRMQPTPRVDVVEVQVRGVALDADPDTGEITEQHAPVNGVEMATRGQGKRILALQDAMELHSDELDRLAGKAANHSGPLDPRYLSKYQADALIATLEGMPNAS